MSTQSSTLILASSFYTGALERPFLDVLSGHNEGTGLVIVPYNQLHTFLLNPNSVIPEGDPARVVLLLRVEDFIRFEVAERGKCADVDREHLLRLFRQRTEEFLEVLNRVSHLRLTVMMCPSARGGLDVSFLGNAIRVAEQKMLAALRSQQRHLLLSWSEMEKGSTVSNWFNASGDRLAHVPFTPEGLDGIAQFVLSQFARMPAQSMVADSTPAVDLERFLASLDLRIAIRPMVAQDEQRLMDLVRHTTHFINVPGAKYGSGNLLAVERSGGGREFWVVRVSDRFGDYGISGMVSFTVEHGSMLVEVLFLSCPVLGKQVEHAFLSWLANWAERQGAEAIDLPFVYGRDNEVLGRLIARLQSPSGELAPSQLGTRVDFRLPVSGLADRVSKEAPSAAVLSDIISRMQFAEANA